MSVIDSLSAGFRVALRNLELVLLPFILDGLLWSIPRLSIEPLLLQAAGFYSSLEADAGLVGSELVAMSGQMADLLAQLGRSINLWELLANGALYHVPSFLVTFSSLRLEETPMELETLGIALQVFIGLVLLGLLIGVIYMNLLARTLPLGEVSTSEGFSEFWVLVMRHWLRTIGLVFALVLILLALYVPGILIVSVIMLFSPVLSSGMMVLVSGMAAVLFFYLYFASVGLVLDDLPVRAALLRSMSLVHRNFWGTLGLILISGLISAGIGLLLSELAVLGTVGALAAGVANAFVGTGLALAVLVFYRTRLISGRAAALNAESG